MDNTAPKRRLLFVVHSLQLGGTERLVLEIAAAVQAEYDIGICCLDGQGTLWEEAALHGYQLYQCHRQPGWHRKNFSSVIAAIRDFKPDLIHAHQYTPFFFCAIAKLLAPSRAKLILTEHGRHIPDLVSAKRRFANRFLVRTVSAITAVSEFSKRALIENEGLTGVPIEVIYNGLKQSTQSSALEKPSLRKELGIAESIKLIGFVGSLRPGKNPAFLLEAFNRIALEQPDAALVYIGDGPLRAELLAEIQERGLTGRAFLAGERNPASPYYKQFSVFVLPSLSEAASLALLEAMASEVPVIVTDRGGSPELVGHGASGMVVTSGDVEQLSGALRRALNDEQCCQELVADAKRRVDEQFTFERMIEKYSDLYASL